MTTDLGSQFREIAEALVADAPEAPAFGGYRELAPSAPRRRIPLSAAAAVTVLGIGGLTIAGRGGHNDPASTEVASVVPTTSPLAGDLAVPTLYPVIDNLPDDAAAEWSDDRVFATDTGPNAAALIGEMNDDGGVLSTLTVRAGVRLGPDFERSLGQLVEGVGVFGVAGSLYENSEAGGPAGTRTVLWGTPPEFYVAVGSPYLMLTGQPAVAGADPVEFLGAASPDFATIIVANEAGPVEMVIGDLPNGFELLSGPQSFGGSLTSTSAILRLTPSGSFVETSTFDPLIGNVGALDRVDINGQPGWVNDTGSVVVWQVDDTTWARAVSLQVGDAVALAESVTFVDEATWADLYDPQPAPTGPEFVPITSFEYPDLSQTGGPESTVPVSVP